MEINVTRNSNSSLISSHVTTRLIRASCDVPQVTNLVLILASMHLAVSFVQYRRRNSALGGERRVTAAAEQNSTVLMVLSQLMPLLALLRYLLTQLVMAVERLTGWERFLALRLAADLSLATAILPSHLFMWYRQRLLYTTPSLKHLRTKAVRATSALAVATPALSALLVVVADVVPATRHRDGTRVVACSVIALRVLSHLAVFALFSYPLRSHQRRTERLAPAERTSTRLAERIERLMRRAVLSLEIVVVGQALAFVAMTTLPRDRRPCVTDLVWDASVFADMMSVVVSYDRPRQLVLGVFLARKPASRSDEKADEKKVDLNSAYQGVQL